MSSCDGLEILRKWQTMDRTLALTSGSMFGFPFDAPVRVAVVDPSTLVISRQGSDEGETVDLNTVAFSSIAPSGTGVGSVALALELKFPDGKFIVISERR